MKGVDHQSRSDAGKEKQMFEEPSDPTASDRNGRGALDDIVKQRLAVILADLFLSLTMDSFWLAMARMEEKIRDVKAVDEKSVV